MTRVFGELGFGEMGHNRTHYILKVREATLNLIRH